MATSNVQDIIILVDASLDPSKVQMFAADKSIVTPGSNSQGTYELDITVPVDTVLRWYVGPVQNGDRSSLYEGIVTKITISSETASDNLDDMTSENGYWKHAQYQNDGGTVTPGSGIAVTLVESSRPYLQCNAHRPTDSGRVTYQLQVSVFKNGEPAGTVSWDPYIHITD